MVAKKTNKEEVLISIYYYFDLESSMNYLKDNEIDREKKIKLGENFIGKGIKVSSKDYCDYEDFYENLYCLKSNDDLYIYTFSDSNFIHELVIRGFKDGDYGIWLIKNAPYYYKDGKIINYFTGEEASENEICSIEENKYLRKENRIMDDFLWIYADDTLIFPSEVEEVRNVIGEGSSDFDSDKVGAVSAGENTEEVTSKNKGNKSYYSISNIGKNARSYVTHGATLRCSKGTTPNTLKIIDKNQIYIKGKPVATIDDCKAMMNIPSFATCRRRHSPPCTPIPGGKWKNGKNEVLVNGKPSLMENSTIKCAHGGTIKIIDPGQKLIKE